MWRESPDLAILDPPGRAWATQVSSRGILLTLALLTVWVPVAACLPLPEYKGGQAAHGTLPIIVRASLNKNTTFAIVRHPLGQDRHHALDMQW